MSDKEQFSILIVDDDPLVVRVLHSMLSDFTPVRFATSGRAALKLAREAVPDLMLLDVEMPDINGFEVCKILKADPALAEIAVIFATSHDSSELEARGLQLGAVDFIKKPANVALVLAVVRAQQRAKQKLSDTLRSAILMDFLTGCANRRHIEKTLAIEWLRTKRAKTSLSLVLVDICAFKDFNAQHGEESGDHCLRRVADELRSVLRRPADLVARYAGGKFALLLPETDARGATAVARRAIRTVDSLQILRSAAPTSQYVTVSAGIACCDWRSADDYDIDEHTQARLSGMTAEHLITAAEQALESANRSRDDRVALLELSRLGEPNAASSLRQVNGQ
jgi:diguanylate cyclase (GGDEF)-like protein